MLEKKLNVKLVNENSLLGRIKASTVKHKARTVAAVGITLASIGYSGCGEDGKQNECCAQLSCPNPYDYACYMTNNRREADQCVTSKDGYEDCCKCKLMPTWDKPSE